MSINNASAVSGMFANTGSSTPSASNPGATLGESQFLTLLAAELKYQDPTKPMNNTQFVAELAQFSTLSAATSQEKTLTSILGLLQGQNPMVAASQLIGKTVVTSTGQGPVTGVIMGPSGIEADVTGLGTIPLSAITGVMAS